MPSNDSELDEEVREPELKMVPSKITARTRSARERVGNLSTGEAIDIRGS